MYNLTEVLLTNTGNKFVTQYVLWNSTKKNKQIRA